MNRELVLGVVLTAGGLAGYVLGLFVAYPGRAFAVSAVMVGVTLLAIGDRRPASTAAAAGSAGGTAGGDRE